MAVESPHASIILGRSTCPAGSQPKITVEVQKRAAQKLPPWGSIVTLNWHQSLEGHQVHYCCVVTF